MSSASFASSVIVIVVPTGARSVSVKSEIIVKVEVGIRGFSVSRLNTLAKVSAFCALPARSCAAETLISIPISVSPTSAMPYVFLKVF